ncbi:MAG: serine hydrolase [Stackebrandtia sp.]
MPHKPGRRASSLAAVVVMTAALGAGCDEEPAGEITPRRADPPASAAPSEPGAAERQAALESALNEYLDDNPGVSASVSLDVDGSTLHYRDDETFETASIAKLEILTRWLLLRNGDKLPRHELDLASRMITVSDNNAANELCMTIARATRPGDVPGGTDACVDEGLWGEDLTTAADQLAVLNFALDPEGELDEADRDVVLRLMGEIADDQNWGVSAAARDGEPSVLKNGWDVRDGGWVVHSVGVVGDDLRLAILTHGHADVDSGIASVEDIAALTRAALDG